MQAQDFTGDISLPLHKSKLMMWQFMQRIWLEIMQKTKFRNLGTAALQLAYVAKGSLIATIINRPKLWDIAAGALIAEAAGAIVSDWQGGKIFPVDLDSYQGQELRVITANKKVHTELLELIKS